MTKALAPLLALLILVLPICQGVATENGTVTSPRQQIPFLGSIASYIKALCFPDVITSAVMGSLVSLVVSNLFGPITLGLFGLFYGFAMGMWLFPPFPIVLAIAGAILGLIAPIGMLFTANPFLGVSVGILSELLSLEPLGAGAIGAIISALTGWLNFPSLVFFIFIAISLFFAVACGLFTPILLFFALILLFIPILGWIFSLFFFAMAVLLVIIVMIETFTVGIYLVGLAIMAFLNGLQGAVSGFVTKWILVRLRI